MSHAESLETGATAPGRVTIYTPDSALRDPGRLLGEMFRDLWAGANWRGGWRYATSARNTGRPLWAWYGRSSLYTDIGKSFPLVMQFLMCLTPVVFAMPAGGWAATVFQLNPLTPLILTARDWLTGMTPAYLGYFLGVNLGTLVLLFAMWIVFRAAMPILIERMSA